MKISFIINNLDCPSCATKIEQFLMKRNDIQTAGIDFIGKKLMLISDYEYSVSELTAIIQEIEPDVYLQGTNPRLQEEIQPKTKLYFELKHLLYIIGLVVFLINQFELNIFGLYIASYILLAHGIMNKAYKNIQKKIFFDENVLMIIATVAAFMIGEYSEAVMIIVFFQVGEYLQDLAVNKSRSSINKLLEIRPNTATVIRGDRQMEIPAIEIEIGDILVVAPHEIVAADGVIVSGESSLNLAAINGESKPKTVKVDDEVLSGSVNLSSPLRLEVSKLYEDSYASKIIHLVEEATSNKSETEQFFTQFARVYTPIVVIVAFIIFCVKFWVLGTPINDAAETAIIFLVISCPCALVISIPLAYFGGVGLASNHKILVKGAKYLEAVNKIETVIFDKTGTLTTGEFTVSKQTSQYPESEYIDYLCSIEANSNHVIAKAIVDNFHYNTIEFDNIKEVPSMGIMAELGSDVYKVGNAKFTEAEEIDSSNTLVYMTKNDVLQVVVELGDKIKEGVKETIDFLQANNVKPVIVSGDNKRAVEQVAKTLNITEFHGQKMAHEKITILEQKLASSTNKVAFVGDGINDAPCIKQADIGFAMGAAGNDVAIEAGDIVLVNDNPEQLISAWKISKSTKNVVLQNIVLALGVKFTFMALALFGYATIFEAIFADVGVSIIAILNAYQLTKRKIDNKQ
ncbi:MAG: heavy metal translocating P-type ATPase [Mycoplasmatales bacterium]